MATVIPVEISEKSILADDGEREPSEGRIAEVVHPLAKPEVTKKFWFQKVKQCSLDNVATQVYQYNTALSNRVY